MDDNPSPRESDAGLRVTLIVLGGIKDWQRCAVMNTDMSVETAALPAIQRWMRGESRDDLVNKLRRMVEQCQSLAGTQDPAWDTTQPLLASAILGVARLRDTTYSRCASTSAKLTIVMADLERMAAMEPV